MANDQLAAMSYLFADPPEAGHAMARLEIVTSGGSTGLSMPDVLLVFRDGHYTAGIKDAGRSWRGEGCSQTAAIIALLADRAGYHAVVTHKEGE